MVSRYIETEIAMEDKRQSAMGLENTLWVKGIIDLEAICHFYEDPEDPSNCKITNEYGEFIFIVRLSYAGFKKLFLNYRNSVDTFAIN